MANLCKCNNCDNILIDNKPKENAPEFNLIGIELNMMWSVMEQAWVCPICVSDNYLTDIHKQPNSSVKAQRVNKLNNNTHAHA
jgi:hypothetical protein